MQLEKPKRKFVDKNFSITTWDDVNQYYQDLLNRSIDSKKEFKKWLEDRSEMEAVLAENFAWRYIQMTIDTRDEKLKEDYMFFVREIQPRLSPLENDLNIKLAASPFKKDFKKEAYQIYFRAIESALQLFRKENIPLHTEIAEKSQEFSSISGAQSIEHEGKELTMQAAAMFLKETDESLRKTIFEKTTRRRLKDVAVLNNLFSTLIALRHKVALNAGFDDFRDYKFVELGRFDYAKEDCFDFHESIKESFVPLIKKIQEKRKKLLTKEVLKPWDNEVDPLGRKPLRPFKNESELLTKTIRIFDKVDPYFAECLSKMDEIKHLDLASKPGKSPGGYNYPLYETGVPFIFMNAVGSHRDLVTMIHEGGHAVHSFLSRDLSLTAFKSLPSEVAELASMSMELMTMEHWSEFYSNKEDFKRAKQEQLETILMILPWVATIDKFQHWVYENPNHSVEERHSNWNRIQSSFSSNLVDWAGYENAKDTIWQRQLHLFEVPFYYIEYGMAQLGAIAIWKNYTENPTQTLKNFKNALSLGYTKSIPEIYEIAGVKFDFSKENVSALAEFIQSQLDEL